MRVYCTFKERLLFDVLLPSSKAALNMKAHASEVKDVFSWRPEEATESRSQDFLDSPTVKAPRFQYRDKGSIPGRGTKILRAMRCGQKKIQVSSLLSGQ